MHSRRKLLAAASTSSMLALAGCGALGGNGNGNGGSSGSSGSSSNGGNSDRPKEMAGVTLNEKVFEIQDGGSGPDTVVIGAQFDNSNSQEATLSLAFELAFPDDSFATDTGQYTAPPGQSTFEGPLQLTADSPVFTESQVEYIQNGDYEYDIWMTGVEGVPMGESGSGTSDGDCDPSLVGDDETQTINWDGYANGATSIESVDLTVTNIVDFDVSMTVTLLFYKEEGDIRPATVASRSEVIPAGETREYNIGKTGLESRHWSVQMQTSCP